MLTEAIRMQHGKTASAILSASFQDWRSLRQMGHTGCSVEHYVWDRASIIALERMTRQWHLEQPHDGSPATVSEEKSRLTEFALVTPCSLHDSQNAFQVGLSA